MTSPERQADKPKPSGGINPVYRALMSVDALVSSAVFTFFQSLSRGWGAYASFLERFRVWGVSRIFVDLVDDAATFALVFVFGLITYALPPFSGTGDVWNKNREYAVTFTDVNGELIGHRGIRQDDAIPFSEIPDTVKKAVMATEDSRFYDHFGVDIQGTIRAMVANAKAEGVVQGGSTITQQLAKNLFLSPERSLRRKIHEAFLALWIEARLSKDEIFKMYLDRSYLGGGNYGVEAAAQYYFGKSIRDVDLIEAAVLAGLFKAPSKYAPHANLENARARANVVLYRMLEVGYISQGELFEAKRQPITVVNHADYYSPDYFLDWAYKETLNLIEKYNLQRNYVIEVRTTIDVSLQKAAQRIINETLDNEAKPYGASQAALVSMKPDGAIVAIVGGRDYEKSQFNRATDALRQPGSSFKPFVYLAALRAGMTPKTIITDGPVTIRGWSPKNYSRRYYGRTTLTRALTYSYNTVPVHLMLRIGRKAIIDTAHLVGLKSNLLAVPSLPLGANEVTVLDITTGYATFANGGKLATPYTVLEIKRPSGEVIYDRARNAPPPKQVVPEEKIAELNYMLNQVVLNGTGRRAQLGFTPQAGKTGTTQAYRDAWFIGFTAHYVTGVWFGNDDYSSTRRATGGSVPAMTWKKFNLVAHRNKVAAALPGIPLDGSYARYIASKKDDLVIPLAPVVSDELRSSATIEDESGGDLVLRQRRSSDAVVSVLRDMFSVFRSQPRRRVQRTSTGSVNVFRPSSGGGRVRRNFNLRARSRIDRR